MQPSETNHHVWQPSGPIPHPDDRHDSCIQVFFHPDQCGSPRNQSAESGSHRDAIGNRDGRPRRPIRRVAWSRRAALSLPLEMDGSVLSAPLKCRRGAFEVAPRRNRVFDPAAGAPGLIGRSGRLTPNFARIWGKALS